MADEAKEHEADRGRRRTEQAAPPKRKALFVLRRTFREFGDDGGTDLAAALTYYSVLAIFPGLLALLSLVGMFGQAQESVDKIVEILEPLISSTDTLRDHRGPAQRPGQCRRGWPHARHRHPGRAVVGLRVRRRLQPGDEPDLRGRGGPAVLADAADAGHRHRHDRGAVRAGPGDPDRLRARSPSPSGRPSASALISSPSGTSRSGRCSPLVVMVVVALLYWATPNVKFTEVPHHLRSAPSWRSWSGWSPRWASRSTSRTSPPTTRPTARSPESSSPCCGCGSPTWRCCSVPSSTPSSSVGASSSRGGGRGDPPAASARHPRDQEGSGPSGRGHRRSNATSGWPRPARATRTTGRSAGGDRVPVARSAAGVARLSARASLAELDERVPCAGPAPGW